MEGRRTLKQKWIALVALVLLLLIALSGSSWAAKPGKGAGGGKGNGGGGVTPVPDAGIVYELVDRLYLSTIDGGNTGSLGVSGGAPSWLPNDTGVVFYGSASGYGLYFQEIDSISGTAVESPQLLFLTSGISAFATLPRPSMSPVPSVDGEFKYLYASEQPYSDPDLAGFAQYDVVIRSSDGSDRVNLTNDETRDEVSPAFSPGADQIVFVANNYYDLRVMDLQLDESNQIVPSNPGNTKSLVPDGSPIQGANDFGTPSWAHAQDVIVVSAHDDLWIVPVGDPMGAQNITNTPNVRETHAEFSADDTQVYYIRDGDPLCGEPLPKKKGSTIRGIYKRNVDGTDIDGCVERQILLDKTDFFNLRN